MWSSVASVPCNCGRRARPITSRATTGRRWCRSTGLSRSPRTPEAFTYRGWTLSFVGRLDEAIENCHRAIQLDPEFGNPYNDIGSYLMSLGRTDEAPAWFERAKKAPRFTPRHYPYINLARLLAERGDYNAALGELEGALNHRPSEPTCLMLRDHLRQRLTPTA
ncbi:MAG: tetratricopeptide repeat protein [Myxococcota bacterium]